MSDEKDYKALQQEIEEWQRRWRDLTISVQSAVIGCESRMSDGGLAQGIYHNLVGQSDAGRWVLSLLDEKQPGEQNKKKHRRRFRL